MISVITTTHNTPPNVLARTWASLKAQTYTDWEWVIIDDSPGMDVYNQLYGFCSDERFKIRLFRPHVPSGGNIGSIKHDAFMLGRGEYLLELDHDDELTPDALFEVNKAFEENPEVGFVYSDWCEVFADGTSGKYPDGWAFGYGSEYWSEEYGVWVMKSPPLNRTTMSHIVSVPNHVRVWKTSVYRQLGGHNPVIEIADDYELIVRTALVTPMFHIKKMLYKQHIGPHTNQRTRNHIIQETVARVSAQYAGALDDVFDE
jgi:glycosyltransferase involved in cell wall biosynthesis